MGLLALVGVFGLMAAIGWLTLSSLFTGRRDGLPGIDAGFIAFVNTVGFGSVCLMGAWMTRRPPGEVFRLRGFAPRLLLPLVLTGVALPILLQALIVLPFRIGGFEPPASLVRDFLQPLLEILLANPAATFLAVVVVAPLTEEFFFRGLLLSGFEKRYDATRAVVFTTVLFSVAHANPVQLPATLLLGFYLGWLTLRTRSILPAVIAHALNNALGFLTLDEAQRELDPATLLALPHPGLLAGAGVSLVVGGYLFSRFLTRPREV
jgi:membrane protease YdiL (CAAX protease family)